MWLANGRICDLAGDEIAAPKINSDGWMNQGACDTPKPTIFLARPRHAFADGWFLTPTGKGLHFAVFRTCLFLSGAFVVGSTANVRCSRCLVGGAKNDERWLNQGARDDPKPTTLLDRPPHVFSDCWFLSPTGKIFHFTRFPTCRFFSGGVVVVSRADLRSSW